MNFCYDFSPDASHTLPSRDDIPGRPIDWPPFFRGQSVGFWKRITKLSVVISISLGGLE